jgi:hypothetical protein
VIHVREFFYFAASAVLFVLLGGCTSTTVTPPAANVECVQDGMRAPSWVCNPQVADAYVSLAIAEKNGADKAQTIKAALEIGRIEIANQMQSQVREKLNNFARTQESSNKEKVDNLYASIASEIKPRDLHLEEKLQAWTTPLGKVYIHVIAPKSNFDADLKRAVKSSYINHKPTWLSFKSKQSIANLEKEFDVRLPLKQGIKLVELFQVESVSKTIVGRNRRN